MSRYFLSEFENLETFNNFKNSKFHKTAHRPHITCSPPSNARTHNHVVLHPPPHFVELPPSKDSAHQPLTL